MTYAELRRKVLSLGFETVGEYAEDPGIMVDAINTAMREICNVFPLVGVQQITQGTIRPLVTYETALHYDGTVPLVFEASGTRAFYVECAGQGEMHISDDDGARVMALDALRGFRPYRGFVRGKARLELRGDYAVDVRNLAFYGQLYSERLADIPAFGALLRYDMHALTGKDGKSMFLGFLDKVQEGDFRGGARYRPLTDFWIEEPATLVLKGDAQADLRVFYRRDFVPLTAETADGFLLELDADKLHLLPLLAAWYVWADDEPTKAAKWRNDYEDFKQTLLLQQERDRNCVEDFYNGLGW